MSPQYLVLLDFDGVVNAVTAKPMASAHPHWEHTEICRQPIWYAPAVIDTINAIAEKPNVTVKWLTSWEERTAAFAAALGVAELDYLSPLPGYSGDLDCGDWKATAGLAAAQRWPSIVVWVDNDTEIEWEVRKADRSNITFIRTIETLGLSKKQLRMLDELTD